LCGLAGCSSLSMLLLLQAADASAYIDPGYGALVQQVLLTGAFGALYLARKAIRRVAGRIARLFAGSGRPKEGERASEDAETRACQQIGPPK
jgi:hypothetical protein